jgi:N utilization substance protein A
MAKKKPTKKKKPSPKKKTAKARSKSTVRGRKKPIRRKKAATARTLSPGPRARIHQGVNLKNSGVGDADSESLADKAGQSGDVQGLSSVEDVDSESVEELVEEGQAFEAEAVSGVENAPDADQGEVKTKEVPEDDVPSEYRDYREQ